MSSNPYESPDTSGNPPEAPPRWQPSTLLELFVVIAVIGVLVALLLPARRGAGEAQRRFQCANNLKQIALGLLNYEEVHGALPPAYTVDVEGRPLHSWRTLILPYMEQKALYEKIDLSRPWDDPANHEAYNTPVEAYVCPSSNVPAGHTTYLAVVGPNGCFRPAEGRKLSEIADRGETLLAIEAHSDDHIHWMAPSDADERFILALASSTEQPHSVGFEVVLADGSTRFLSSEIDKAELRALISVDK